MVWTSKKAARFRSALRRRYRRTAYGGARKYASKKRYAQGRRWYKSSYRKSWR